MAENAIKKIKVESVEYKIAPDAVNVSYDNVNSSRSSTDMQGVIDEIDADFTELQSHVAQKAQVQIITWGDD